MTTGVAAYDFLNQEHWDKWKGLLQPALSKVLGPEHVRRTGQVLV